MNGVMLPAPYTAVDAVRGCGPLKLCAHCGLRLPFPPYSTRSRKPLLFESSSSWTVRGLCVLRVRARVAS